MIIYNNKEYFKFFSGERKCAYVSKTGDIITVTNSAGTIKEIKWSISKSGYARVSYDYIHRIVAQTFLPNPENKLQVNHIDGNKLNNSVENLEWCTNGENAKHAHNTGLNRTRKGVKHTEESKSKISQGVKEMHKRKKMQKVLQN